MIVIDKGPNKGLLFDTNTGSTLGHPVGFLFCPEFLPPQIHPTTRWLDYKSSHTMAPSHVGFFFFITTTFKDLVYGQSSSHWQRLRVSSSRGFFLFYHEPYQPQRINKGGSPFRPPPWAKSLILTVHRLGLSPQTFKLRHTHGSESLSIVQGLVQDLNVYKTHGE